MLAREILILRGKISRQSGFLLDGKEIMPDLYFYRDPTETEKEETGAHADVPEVTEFQQPVDIDFTTQVGKVDDWAAETATWTAEAKADDWASAPTQSNW